SLGEKSCSAVVRSERQRLRAVSEAGGLRLWVGDSDSVSYLFNSPEEGRYLEGAQWELCKLRRSVVGTWTGSYRGQAATLVLKSGRGNQVKGTITVAALRGGPDVGRGTPVKNDVKGSFDPETGQLLLEDLCTTPDCGHYSARVTGARMSGTMKPELGPESTFSLALP
ncbi:MAG TPA: hypothetical protein PLA94_17150, partial [Myxococcota bacterium]|nr:hypothetical protein [Myxococcota bacterium]